MAKPKWKPKQMEAAIKAYTNGMGCPNIKKKFGIPGTTLTREVDKRGIPRHPKGNMGKTGPDHPSWKGGFLIDRYGYVRTYDPKHPFPRTSSSYVQEHVRVMELHIGRRIKRNEVVHHKDENRRNNVLTNLKLMTRSEHARLHRELEQSRKRKQKSHH